MNVRHVKEEQQYTLQSNYQLSSEPHFHVLAAVCMDFTAFEVTFTYIVQRLKKNGQKCYSFLLLTVRLYSGLRSVWYSFTGPEIKSWVKGSLVKLRSQTKTYLTVNMAHNLAEKTFSATEMRDFLCPLCPLNFSLSFSSASVLPFETQIFSLKVCCPQFLRQRLTLQPRLTCNSLCSPG